MDDRRNRLKNWLKGSRKAPWLLALIAALLMAAIALSGGRTGETSATAEEQRIARVLSAMRGAGKVEVALYYEPSTTGTWGAASSSKPCGAVIVAQGAQDMEVRLALIRAVRTLLGLPENAVDVFKMEELP